MVRNSINTIFNYIYNGYKNLLITAFQTIWTESTSKGLEWYNIIFVKYKVFISIQYYVII